MRILVKSGIDATAALAAGLVNSHTGARLAPLLGRLHAWWEGEAWHGEAAASLDSGAAAQGGAPWSPARRQVVESLWGRGVSSPGGAAHLRGLIAPLGLGGGQAVVDLGAGLGGGARLIAAETGVEVSGLEADPALAQAAMEISTAEGLAERAPVAHFQPPRLGLGAASHDAVFSKEALYALADKDALLEECHRVLKPGGQILFTDYLLPADGHRSSALDAWLADERPQPRPWSVARALARLGELGFEVRAAEDISAPLKDQVLAGWAALVDTLDPGTVPREVAGAVVDEAELWCRRIALIDAGDIRCHRIHALKRAA